jgi:hypothetical protein
MYSTKRQYFLKWIIEYVTYLSNKQQSLKKLAVALSVRNPHLPEELFFFIKYIDLFYF